MTKRNKTKFQNIKESVVNKEVWELPFHESVVVDSYENGHVQSQEKVERNTITTTTKKKGKRNRNENGIESKKIWNLKTVFQNPYNYPQLEIPAHQKSY